MTTSLTNSFKPKAPSKLGKSIKKHNSKNLSIELKQSKVLNLHRKYAMGIENSKTPQITLDKKRNLKKLKNTSKKHSQVLIQKDINCGYILGDKDPFKIIKNISNR